MNDDDLIVNFQYISHLFLKFLLLFLSKLAYFNFIFHFYTPEKVRKPLVFWRFQGV